MDVLKVFRHLRGASCGHFEVLLGFGESQGILRLIGGSHTKWPSYIIRVIMGNYVKASWRHLGIRKGLVQ